MYGVVWCVSEVWGVRRPLDVPQNGKSASFRSCVRAGEAKLRVCVSGIMLLYAG